MPEVHTTSPSSTNTISSLGKRRGDSEVYYLTKRRKVFVEVPRLAVQFALAAESATPSTSSYDTSSWDVKRGRGRSLSVDSVSESELESESESEPEPESGSKKPNANSETKGTPTVRRLFDAVEIKSYSNLFDRRYRPGKLEEPIHIQGEKLASDLGPNDIPVRFLDDFTFYDPQHCILPFFTVINQLSSSKRGKILGSGRASCCLDNGQVTSTNLTPYLSLSEIIDYWTDYTTRDLTGLWNIRRIALKTKFSWYILREPALRYATDYRPFWLAHFITWRAVHAMRQKPNISRSEFLEYLKKVDDSEFLQMMGRQISESDLSHSSNGIYLREQLSGNHMSLQSLKKYPLVHSFIQGAETPHRATPAHELDTTGRTVATSRVFRVAQHLFHRSLLVDGEACPLPQETVIANPPILHPDNPSKIHWGSPITGQSNCYNDITIDGETYAIGDTIMVNPGEDRLHHRALNAEQPYSQDPENILANCVWFCKIQRIFSKNSPGSGTEPFLHVQWFEHSTKTILQETAHPLELFGLFECDDIHINSLLGPVKVSHLDPADNPESYYCRFLWDYENAKFVDYIAPAHLVGTCPACKRDPRRSPAQKHPAQSITVNHVEYHRYDFVYITGPSSRLYKIGQILAFSGPNNEEVLVLLFGRFDDVARLEGNSDQQYDERRLFLTEEKIRVSPKDLEGKCWIIDYDEIDDDHGFETFYVDRRATRQKCSTIADLEVFQGKIKNCETCLQKTRHARDKFRTYKRDNVPLRTMELFAGAGGLSTGLEQTGLFKSFWAVELSSNAAATFQQNHHDCIVYNEDTNMCLQSALNEAAGKPGLLLKTINDGPRLMPRPGEVDIIAGGFPCQSFSGMNRQRQYSDDDIRTTLVVNLLSYVDFYRPRFVLMENVKGLLQHHSRVGYTRVGEEIVDTAEVVKMSMIKFILRTLLYIGYQVQFRVLEAADYGSPQRRERVIFMAARCGEILPSFPIPTHVTESHRGQVLTLPTGDKLRPVERSSKQCAPFRALTVADAISDLPSFEWKHPGCASECIYMPPNDANYKILQAVSEPNRTLVGFPMPVAYRTEPLTRYQQSMRTSEQMVTLHCSRTFQMAMVERVWHICSHQNPEPSDVPQDFWTSALIKAKGNPSYLNKIWKARFACRLQWDKAFNTALTKCRPFTKGGNTLHPKQNRIITARECARSQGFPDDYHFVQISSEGGPKDWGKLLDDIHKQIGNAVPVPLAKALGRSIGSALVEKWSKNT